MNMEKATATDRTALIAYGTETGNAQDAAEDAARLCERLRFKTHVLELDLISLVCTERESRNAAQCKARDVSG